jgi:hypothetical protein
METDSIRAEEPRRSVASTTGTRVPLPILLSTWNELLYARMVDFAIVANDPDFDRAVFEIKQISVNTAI